jgi:hypothetical protein
MASFGNSVLKRSQGARDEGRLGELRRPRAGRQSVGLNETYLPFPIITGACKLLVGKCFRINEENGEME